MRFLVVRHLKGGVPVGVGGKLVIYPFMVIGDLTICLY
jgi:hypothetical protein